MLSVIIPSRNEKYLSKTVDDLFAKAQGKIEVIVILDEQDQKLAPRPNLFVHKKTGKPGLRTALNQAIGLARGKYIMKTDAHCMFGEGFDKMLIANCEDNWVVIPRRYSLDPETWSIRSNRPIIDYEYFVFPWVTAATTDKTGGKWHQRGIDRAELLLDEDMAFQGSCWLTTKQHIIDIGGFSDDTSTGDDFVCESEELANKTWFSGGKVMVNKETWYAHWYKGSAGRGYFIATKAMRRQRKFHDDYWMHDKWPKARHKMAWLVEKFMPIPGWPEDWQNPKYEQDYLKSLEKNGEDNK